MQSQALDMHIEATKLLKRQAAQPQSAPITAAGGNATEGQAAGNEIAAAAGAAVPQ